MKRGMLLLLFVALVAPLAGCSFVTSMDVAVASDFWSRKVQKVAVVHISGQVHGEAMQALVGDTLAMQFIRKGYDVSERKQAFVVFQEQQRASQGMNIDQVAVQAGKLLGVDAVLVMNIPKFGKETQMSLKMLDVRDGKILYVVVATGNTGKTFWTVVGTITGGVVGAYAGDSVGALVGGVAGGVAGNTMTPSKESAIRRLIEAICKKLPLSAAPHV